MYGGHGRGDEKDLYADRLIFLASREEMEWCMLSIDEGQLSWETMPIVL